jgi:hypothetical protein
MPNKKKRCLCFINILKYICCKPRKKDLKFVSDFAQDLVTSCFLTICTYFLISICVSLLIRFNLFHDPSELFEYEPICAQSNMPRLDPNGEPAYSHEMIVLATLANHLLKSTELNYFICYRSLLEFVKLNASYTNTNRLDLCLHLSEINERNIEENMLFNFFGHDLSQMFDSYSRTLKFTYVYNRMYGYYHLKHGTANLYIYLFLTAPANKHDIESIKRYGIFFSLLKLYISTNLFESSVNVNSSALVSLPMFQVKNKFKNENVLFTFKNGKAKRTNYVQRTYPIYMIENMPSRQYFARNYFPVPSDPHVMLMYMYPTFWSFEHCNN